MTYLLDANVLIAFCDPYHSHHAAAHRWFKTKPASTWATCPITENAFVRITSKLTYPDQSGTVSDQIEILRTACSLPGHVFWPDDVSLLASQVWKQSELATPKHLTDLYLLTLAVKHGGKLATFDQRIPAKLIRNGPEALLVLPG